MDFRKEKKKMEEKKKPDRRTTTPVIVPQASAGTVAEVRSSVSDRRIERLDDQLRDDVTDQVQLGSIDGP